MRRPTGRRDPARSPMSWGSTRARRHASCQRSCPRATWYWFATLHVGSGSDRGPPSPELVQRRTGGDSLSSADPVLAEVGRGERRTCACRRDPGVDGTRDRRRRDLSAAAGRRGRGRRVPSTAHQRRTTLLAFGDSPIPTQSARPDFLHHHQCGDAASRSPRHRQPRRRARRRGKRPGVRCIVSAGLQRSMRSPSDASGLTARRCGMIVVRYHSLAENVVEAAKRWSNRIGEQAPATSGRNT